MKKKNLFSAFVISCVIFSFACQKTERPAAEKPLPSQIQVSQETASAAGLTLKSSKAEFTLLPSGYLVAKLLRNGERLTLDAPEKTTPDSSVPGVNDFVYDFARAQVSEARGKLGARGKRVEVVARSRSTGLEKTLAVELYDDFPEMAVTTSAYKNTGAADFKLPQVHEQARRLDASLLDRSARPHQLWSFQGGSIDWGRETVFPLRPKFVQANLMAEPINQGHGGGIPVVAFWNRHMGEAVGHLETVPLVLSLPVRVAPDGKVHAEVELKPETVLKPGEIYSTPRAFVAVYEGDFYQPLRLYSQALQREGWNIPKPNREDYNVAWCGWGYEFNVTPAQMIGTIPKLKELGIKWATLDDRWFDTYGDWNPRQDTFPGDSIKKMVDTFHKEGLLAQIWWLPIGVEDGKGKYESHHYKLSQVARQHPDWLILDKQGKPAHMIRDLAGLCPAVPEVQQYYKSLTERFICDWDFDGHKLDNIYSVPFCYNPQHHHKSPQDSVKALADVHRIIFETTRALKPESVTQICPCGTTPNIAWLPYMDQAVTADPVGGRQVRQRIKMYKALLGPESAVYGDHVELSEMERTGKDQWREHGRDFASTIGAGGVVGTKFTWPNPTAKFKTVALTADKEALWKKWIGIYNAKMLSSGTFRDLYVTGYDSPEAYAIEKDGKMYYAFFAPESTAAWSGEVELRGLNAGKYRILDYVNGKDYGVRDAEAAKLKVQFTGNLLLEASPI